MPASTSMTVRPLEVERDGVAMVDLRCRAFGRLSDGERTSWLAHNGQAMRDRRFLGAFDGERLVAMARFHDMVQCWHGRAVPMAGVSSVAVVPEERGRGVGRALMTAVLDAIAAGGYPLSVLFPSTMPLYRSLGWEVGGTSYEAVFSAPALRSLALPSPASQPDAVRRAGPQDVGLVRQVIERAHLAARDCGPSVRDETAIRLAIRDPDNYFYLADDGLLGYTWRNGHDELFVHTAVAVSEQTTRALWGIVASYCWMADIVRARVGPADPVWWLTSDPVADAVDHDDWMLRVVDPAAAIAARGFPAAASLAVPLHITDPARPALSGPWRGGISGGPGARLPPRDAATPSLALGARGLAALYAGTPVATLRRAGLASGGDPTGDALLDSAFAATPYMLDRF